MVSRLARTADGLLPTLSRDCVEFVARPERREARPGPVRGPLHHSGSDGVVEDVRDRLLTLGIRLDEGIGEAVSEEMATATVSGVVLARVDGVDGLHRPR